MSDSNKTVQFTKSELAGIIACVDKEYNDLWQMYDRQGIDLTDTPIQRHLFSIMKKAVAMAKEMEPKHDDLILCDGIETIKPEKVVLSSLYSEQLTKPVWCDGKPEKSDFYLIMEKNVYGDIVPSVKWYAGEKDIWEDFSTPIVWMEIPSYDPGGIPDAD